MSRALVAAPILICAGCAAIPQPLKTYDGPELPTQQVAQIAGAWRQPSENPQGAIFIACMDGVSLERLWGAYDNGARWPDKVTVTPGRHYLAVVYSLLVGQRASWANVSLDAEAGRHYVIKGSLVEMWVEDSVNGTVAARAIERRGRANRDDPCP